MPGTEYAVAVVVITGWPLPAKESFRSASLSVTAMLVSVYSQTAGLSSPYWRVTSSGVSVHSAFVTVSVP